MKTVMMLAMVSLTLLANDVQIEVMPAQEIYFINDVMTFKAVIVEGTASKYTWDFGDGTTIETTQTEVSHFYPAISSVYVRLSTPELPPQYSYNDEVFIRVRSPAPHFEMQSADVTGMKVGSPYSIALTCVGRKPITLTTKHFPAGMRLDKTLLDTDDTYRLVGTPLAAGIVSGSVTATNAEGSEVQTIKFAVVAPLKQAGDILTKGAFKRNPKKTDADTLALTWSGSALFMAGTPAKDFSVLGRVRVACSFGPYNTGMLTLDSNGKAKNEHASVAYSAQKGLLTLTVKGISLDSIGGTPVDGLHIAKFACKLNWECAYTGVPDNNATGLFKVSGKVTPLDSGKLVGQE